jgi:hypothetical protein
LPLLCVSNYHYARVPNRYTMSARELTKLTENCQ